MALFSRKNDFPTWLESTRQFCKQNNITISAWGTHTLVVEAKSSEGATQIAAQLANLGFKVVADEKDACAGLLTLSHTG